MSSKACLDNAMMGASSCCLINHHYLLVLPVASGHLVVLVASEPLLVTSGCICGASSCPAVEECVPTRIFVEDLKNCPSIF
ncbi:unnamed protein product [Nesidiocoris tenuis]|uniref:Uncharacterized protein n=1 Tax=Nesidiocoris tenuis TaxID=355587 RepID=A0A6H5HSU2_9HEMI|nr:unnamed protein product [Nesidiocoris tenuis]